MAEDKELLRFQKACEEAQRYRPNFSRNFAVIKPAIGFLSKDGVKKFYFVLWFPSEKFENPDQEYGGVLMGPKPWIVTSNGEGRGEIILWHRENLISERIWPESDVDYFDLRWDPEDFWGYWQSGEAPSSREVFNDIVDLLKQYVEYQHEAHYAIAALWIIGTYLQPFFKTYPYLYYHGEKGVGKSLDGDAVVLTLTKTGEVQPVKIGDLVDEALRIGGVVKEGSYETCYGNPLGVKVLQLNPTTLKVEWVEPKAFIRHPFKGEMLRVKTRLGREILATKDHSFIVFKDGEVSVVDGSSLKVGDVFLTVKHIPTQQARPLDWRLLQADVLTDEVVSIEEESYEGYVYDLSTPYENFVANGVVVHNTKTLNIIGLLAFNAVNSLSVTASSLFRICQGSAATLLIDESGYLRNKQRYEELRTLLYGRYKAGQYVQRTDKESGRVQHYRVFGPTALASIEGLEDVLADRVIEIIILRSLNPLILNKEVDDHDSVWQKIRNKLYRLAHRRWREFEQLSEGCASSAGSEATGDRVLSGRSAELWRPLLLLAKWVGEDVHQLVLNYAVESEKVKKESEKASSNNLILLQTLLKLVDRDDYYLIKNIRERVAEEVDEAPAWLTNEWVSRALKRFGFIERRRVGKGTQVHLTPNQVKDVAARFGIIPPPSPAAAQPAQPSQPTQPTEQQASSVL